MNSVQKIDPDIVTNFLDFSALGLIYQTLVQENANLQIEPDLATSWAFSNGNTTLTLHLRQNVKFDDGSTMTSADVVASLQRATATATADPSASFIGSVTNIAASGPNTVVLTMSHPDVSVLEGLATVNMAIMPAAAISAGTIATQPDGTGPFEYSSLVANTSFTMTANPNYWGGKPSLSTVEIETIPTEQSISAALQAGTIQMGLLSEPTVVNTLPKSFVVQKALDLSYRALQLQDKHGYPRQHERPSGDRLRHQPQADSSGRRFWRRQSRRTGAARAVRDEPGLGDLSDPELTSRRRST